MGDCVVVENGHPVPKEEDAPVVAVERLPEGAGKPREEGSRGQRKQGGIRREPSFSRWCKDPSAMSNAPPGGASPASAASDDDSEEFELPLLPSDSGGGGGSHLPMDIEAGAAARSDDLPISPWLIAKVIALIASWYTLSTCLTLYNKEMLGKHMWKFPAPFLMNTVHFTMQAVASRVIVWFQHRGLEGAASAMTWRDYFLRVVPTALATALDINLSNISLVFITVTFATMCKSAAPIFILLFAFLFRLEKPSFNLLGIILIVSFGVLLTGLRNPFTLMSYVTPVMAITTAILSIAMDPWHDVRASHFFDNSTHIIRSSLLMLLGGALAFFMVLTEYVLVSVTSAVTVTVAGIVKEAVTILVAVLFFNDTFTWLKGLGLGIIIFGVSLFNLYKYHRFKKGHRNKNCDKNPQTSSGASKYVILDDDDMENQGNSG
uniref:Sugar phosphate transporter domain-containing protein n=1 Tax=Oryza nivara TaxID=4536 RepID=A0A0E0FT54_ORYNI